MKRIWIIGGGHFGWNAAVRLMKESSDCLVTVVDKDPGKRPENLESPLDWVCMDGIAFLSAGLLKSTAPEWIVPAIPEHVAWQWMKRQLEKEFEFLHAEISDEILSQLPNPLNVKENQVVMSLADFICPDNCPEPATCCTVTRKPRPYDLFRKLECIDAPGVTSIVIRSRQLAPGVGGYPPKDLLDALGVVRSTKNAVLLSTACRCHGVLTAFRRMKKEGIR